MPAINHHTKPIREGLAKALVKLFSRQDKNCMVSIAGGTGRRCGNDPAPENLALAQTLERMLSISKLLH
jgi:hypothetical protein